jgi:hypothetical protein
MRVSFFIGGIRIFEALIRILPARVIAAGTRKGG